MYTEEKGITSTKRCTFGALETAGLQHRYTSAMGKNPDTICVSCPFCMTMFEDGLKDEGAQNVRVRDLTEVVAEGLR